MKIKKLEIKGFKSFPDRTTLEFKPGITAVVGPNGCGKSNILEAIRWTMGEQRARVLRGKKMEEVIFNGSETRKAVGMAETRMVLSNTDGMGPPSMADYDEIMIARRLFRDGESQYEINNIPCRLADVVDFFLDTGVGKNSYAIIEQGRVEMVVSSKPEDRRVLIEEAAGISRYKARREEAVKKLEQTRQNLLRISDVIDEVKRQNLSLKRQAAKAQRYRELSNKLREMDLGLHASLCAEYRAQADALKAGIDQKKSALMELASRAGSDQARLEEEHLRSLQMERALRELLESHHKTELDLASVRSRAERARATIAQLEQSVSSARDQRTRIEEQWELARQRLAELEGSQAQVKASLDKAREELHAGESSSAAAREALQRETTRFDRLKERLFANLQDSARKKNLHESLTRRDTELRVTQEKAAAESEEADARLQQIRRDLEDIGTALSQADQECRTLGATQESLAKKHKHAGYQVGSIREELADEEKELAAKTARLKSLEEMRQEYRGYDEAVRFFMQGREYDPSEAIHGPLAEVIEVPQKYQKALTAALGTRLGHLVVSSVGDGIEAVRTLTEAHAGRSTCIPAAPRWNRGQAPPIPDEELVCLLDVVNVRDGYEALAGFLLGDWYLVQDLDHAGELWETHSLTCHLVTLQGEVVTGAGEVTGGSLDTSQSSLFDKRREMHALLAEISSGEQHVRALRASLSEELSARDTLERELAETNRALNDTKIKSERLRKDQEQMQARIASLESRLRVLSLEDDRLAKERERLTLELQQTLEAISQLQRVHEELEAEREECSSIVGELTASTQEESERGGELRVQVAQLEERGRSLEREVRDAARAASDGEKNLASLESTLSRDSAEKESLSKDLDESLAAEQALMQEHRTQAATIAGLRSTASELALWMKSFEEELAANARTTAELKEQLHGLEMEHVRIRQTEQGLVEKIRERYRVDPREITAPETRPDEHEIAEIRHRLESMGEVNLAAIAESRYVEERLSFLLEQEEDLRKAVDSLFATINKINQTTRERFRAAFDSINERFEEIFPFLFRGGEARLELTDEENLLETGVEIVARPFGKKFQSMHLLSGGEKALTAVALIFSIFLTRPSPFCLLDEVDAPLDDSNLARFNDMLRKVAPETQFIVVTHNKRSMAEADRLYGVTMEEPGVSSVVSVEFKD
ncbi:MAG: chromosome segregation protein SMC [Thermodesulfobacteriota bacterium]